MSTKPSRLLSRTLPRLDTDDPVITISESYIDREDSDDAIPSRYINERERVAAADHRNAKIAKQLVPRLNAGTVNPERPSKR